MTTLHDRLADLADEAAGGATFEDAWDRGLRRHRRQRIGTAAVVTAVVVLLGGLLGLSWTRSASDVQPATPKTELGMPDRFYLPSERLPGTDDTGPIGPLSAVLSGLERPVGISATGEYAFLDLPAWPDLALLDGSFDPAVSADGTQVAYWSVGSPSGEPVQQNTHPVVGVRVYDTVTGEVEYYAVPTEHGLHPLDLVWAGDTVWFEVWQYDGPSRDGGRSSSLEGTIAWNPRAGTWSTWDFRPHGLGDLSAASAWRDALVRLTPKGSLRLVTAEGWDQRARIDMSSGLEGPVFLDAGGARLAGLRDADGEELFGDAQPLVVGELPGEDDLTPVTLREVPGTATRRLDLLLGWRDERHVVGVRGGDGPATGMVSVDVETGEIEVLAPITTNLPVLAADALAGPVFDAPPPPEPLDPRPVYVGVLAILLAGAGVLVWLRRRVQR